MLIGEDGVLLPAHLPEGLHRAARPAEAPSGEFTLAIEEYPPAVQGQTSGTGSGKITRMAGQDRVQVEEYRRLVAACRPQCLWFLREDYCPTDSEGMRRVLGYIRRYGDRESFCAAGRLMTWLSPDSSGRSAAS